VTEFRTATDEISRAGLAELHTQLGGSVDPAVMWTIAHDQGIALPVKDYLDFVGLVTPVTGGTIAQAVAAGA
jgi:hypothetical protein